MAMRVGTARLIGMLFPEDQIVSGEKACALFNARRELGGVELLEAAASEGILGGPLVLGDAR